MTEPFIKLDLSKIVKGHRGTRLSKTECDCLIDDLHQEIDQWFGTTNSRKGDPVRISIMGQNHYMYAIHSHGFASDLADVNFPMFKCIMEQIDNGSTETVERILNDTSLKFSSIVHLMKDHPYPTLLDYFCYFYYTEFCMEENIEDTFIQEQCTKINKWLGRNKLRLIELGKYDPYIPIQDLSNDTALLSYTSTSTIRLVPDEDVIIQNIILHNR